MNDKILWGQIAAVFAIVLGAIWSATQWTAAALGYQPQLGAAWFHIGDYPVYLPPSFFWWWFAFDAYAPEIFATGAMIAASGGFLSIIVAIAMSIWRARERRRAETYGSARWAEKKEIRKAGMLGDAGVILGRLGKSYLRHDGAEHILCFAPTRSGKGVGLVIPTLLTWPGSCIVHDIKGENWELTAGFRARHGRVLLFDPTNKESAAYNPLLEVRRGEWEVRDVQNIADILVDPEGSLETRNHWEKTSHSLLVGAILHVLYAEEDKSLAGVAAFLSNPRRPIATALRIMQTTRHRDDGVHPLVEAAAQDLLHKSPNERSGVLSTAMSFLDLYRDPVVAAVTRRSEWRIADLMSGPHPTSLYFVIPPGDISRTKPLIRLMLNQIGRRLTEELNPGARRHRLLMLLDEFPALGRLDFFESALAFMAGYGIKAFLIAQSLNQIEKAYGPNNAILDNCHIRVSFAANDERTAQRISDALGTATEMRAMKNYAGHRLSPWLGHLMVSRTETARALLTPGEVLHLPEDQQIVMASAMPPIRCAKAQYYVDPRLTRRVLPPPTPASQRRELPADDWTQSKIPVPGMLMLPSPPTREKPAPESAPAPGKEEDVGGPGEDDSGIRREPGLADHENVAPERDAEPPVSEFDYDRDSEQDTAAREQELDRAMRRAARGASLDPDDGIDL